MDTLRKKFKESKGRHFYIKLTLNKLIANLVVVLIICSVIASIIYNKNDFILASIIFILEMNIFFRIGEFLITHKILGYPGFYALILEGKVVYFDLALYLISAIVLFRFAYY